MLLPKLVTLQCYLACRGFIHVVLLIHMKVLMFVDVDYAWSQLSIFRHHITLKRTTFEGAVFNLFFIFCALLEVLSSVVEKVA